MLARAVQLTRNRADAEDLVQDAVVSALGSWAEFEPVDAPDPAQVVGAWLQRILFNRFVTLYRKGGRRTRCLADFAAEVAVDEACRADVPNARLSPGLWGDELEGALSELPPRWREIVERVYVRGELYRDVAADLDVPLNTICGTLFKVRRRLTSELEDFAEREYGLALRYEVPDVGVAVLGPQHDDAGQHASALEATERVQAQADRVERVVAVRDDAALGRRQAG